MNRREVAQEASSLFSGFSEFKPHSFQKLNNNSFIVIQIVGREFLRDHTHSLAHGSSRLARRHNPVLF